MDGAAVGLEATKHRGTDTDREEVRGAKRDDELAYLVPARDARISTEQKVPGAASGSPEHAVC